MQTSTEILKNGHMKVKAAASTAQFKTEIVTVTPKMAEDWLRKNKHNRKLIPRKIEVYAHEMGEGRWTLSNDAIVFSAAGILLNGQHRLHACVKSGVSFEALIVYGYTPKSQDNMDGGTRRTVGCIFSIAGSKFSNNRAAAVRCLAVLAEPSINQIYSNSLALAIYKKNQNSVDVCTDALAPTQVPGPVIGAAAFCHRKTPETVEKFMEQLVSGVGLRAGDPALVLRNMLMKMPRGAKDGKRSRYVSRPEDLGVKVVRAIFAMHRGERLTSRLDRSETAMKFYREAHPKYR